MLFFYLLIILIILIIYHSAAAFQLAPQKAISSRIIQLYSTSSASHTTMPANVKSLVDQAKILFDESFGKDDGTSNNLSHYCVSAPGRVNLIGEHTDYTGGFVLPLAIGYNTVGYGCGRIVKKTDSLDSNRCRVVSKNKPVVEFNASPSLEPSTGSSKWVNYVQGVILQYLPDLKEDEAITFDLAIVGDVPLGSGLSSSASLEVATAVFLESILDNHGVAYKSSKDGAVSEKQRKMERAVRCKLAENTFCGVPCGIMDQFVSSAGCEDKLLLLDCQSLEYREVAMGGNKSDVPVLVITNSNVKHDLGDGEYPIRVKQCKEATDILTKTNPSIQSLRDATMKDVEAAANAASLEGVLLQRARHVVSENERTVKTADALEKGDWKTVGTLMNESHSSMRDDYEVSCEEIDVLVDLAQNFDGVYGSRLTGGGFGGCTVTLVKKDASKELMEYLKKQYESKTGTNCVCFETSPADGANKIDL